MEGEKKQRSGRSAVNRAMTAPIDAGAATCLIFAPDENSTQSILRPYSCCSAAWAAASRAMGTRNGEQET